MEITTGMTDLWDAIDELSPHFSTQTNIERMVYLAICLPKWADFQMSLVEEYREHYQETTRQSRI